MKDMTKITDFIKKNKYPLILALLVLVLCVYPLSFTQIYTGHDLKFHLCRIDCIADNIEHGNWFSPIYTTYLDGYGYASPLFYGDIFLHIPGFLTYLGMTAEASLRVFVMIITAATAFVTYYCSKSIFKNGLSAFVSAVAYTFSAYFCVDFITRVALGELQAFVFLPVIACGFHSIMFEDGKKWYLLPLGLTFCLLSHVMTSVFCVVFLIVISLIFIKRFIEKPKRLAVIAVSAAVFFCLSAFFIFPLLEQMGSHDFAVNDGSAALQWGTLESRAMPSSAIFSSFVISKPVFSGINCVTVLFGGWPYAGGSDPWIPNGMGVLPIVIFVIIFVCEMIKKKTGTSWPFLIAGLVTLLCTTNLFPWAKVQSLLGSLQFPWRLLIFVTFFMAFAAAAFIARSDSKKLVCAMAVSVVGLSLFAYCYTGSGKYSNMYSLYEKGETRVIDYENTIGAGEYMPTYYDEKAKKQISAATIKSRVLKRGGKVTSNNILNANDLSLKRDFDELTVSFKHNGSDDTYIELPLLMYKGYSAEINGKDAEVTWGKDNVVRVNVGSTESGKITVRYTGTTLRKICVVVSILSFISLIAYLVIRKFIPRKAPTPSRTYIPAHEATELSSEELPESDSDANYNRGTE